MTTTKTFTPAGLSVGDGAVVAGGLTVSVAVIVSVRDGTAVAEGLTVGVDVAVAVGVSPDSVAVGPAVGGVRVGC